MKLKGSLWLALGLPGTMLAAFVVLACGPDFPNMLLTQGDSAVLIVPQAKFAREVQRIAHATRYKYVAPLENGEASLEAELADLKVALQGQGTFAEKVETVIEQHRRERVRLKAAAAEVKVQAELPAEFALYFRGCVEWNLAQWESEGRERFVERATAAWKDLVELPAAQRKYKATWAAYMLGVAAQESSEPEQAIQWYQKVRELADAGFADSLGLAAASLGWEAQIYFGRQQFAKAIELYLVQSATGDPTAVESLRMVAGQALKSANLEDLAKDPSVARILTAFLVSGRSPAFDSSDPEGVVMRWLDALESQDAMEIALAEQLALVAYEEGEMETARRWLDRALPTSFATRWLTAKLHLYEGDLKSAADMLSGLVREFPPMDEARAQEAGFGESLVIPASATIAAADQVRGELGVIRLARREFTEALDALLGSGYWLDAAYVAERVLTLDELKVYVDEHWQNEEFAEGNEGVRGTEIRYLLARRLARAGRNQEALAYFPAESKERYREFLAARAAGMDLARAPRERARELFRAAKLLRETGMEMLGTETAPDWHFYGGNFSAGVMIEERSQISSPEFLVPTSQEIERALVHGPTPDTRFHYRYVAAELAMNAARLLPDNDPETAIVLCTAGSWIKYLDPQAADRFYKMLVRRCRKTPIGKEADSIRWFPLIDDDGKILPRLIPAPVQEPAPFFPPPEVEPIFPSFVMN